MTTDEIIKEVESIDITLQSQDHALTTFAKNLNQAAETIELMSKRIIELEKEISWLSNRVKKLEKSNECQS